MLLHQLERMKREFKMTKPLISVIVPVYKVEQYLERCVKSIINQTYSNLEIILVDDGSPDNCPAICDNYTCLDKRIKVFHKENGGLSDARNAGLEIATGEYITFVDSDDWISDNCIEVLYNSCCQYAADISIIDTVETDGTKKYENSFSAGLSMQHIYTPEEAMYVIFTQSGFNTSAWAKLYKYELIQKFRFTKGILYEDLDIMYRIFAQAKKIVFSNKAQYYYFQRAESIVHMSFDDRHFVLLDISHRIVAFIDQNYPDLHNAAMCRLVFSEFLILSRIKNENEYGDERRRICDYLIEMRKEIYHNKEINLKQKLKVMLVYLYRKLGRI